MSSARSMIDGENSQPDSRIVADIHREVVRALEWSGGSLNDADGRDNLQRLIEECCRQFMPHAQLTESTRVVAAVKAEMVGLGPLEPLLEDESISDIMVNRWNEVFIERSGRLERSTIRFMDDAHVVRIIQRVAARIGRRIDEGSPVVDARMEDGTRVHAVLPPLASRGPTLSIRRSRRSPLSLGDLVDCGFMLPSMAEFLAAAVEAQVNLVISGGSGAGKTTLLNALAAFIPPDERVLTIEDTAELRLNHPHVVSLEARTANVDGSGAITIRELVRNSLRMRPNRIIVGEVRSAEALDMLQAMNTGHDGSMTTLHANNTRDALARLELMVSLSGIEFSSNVLRQYIASGVRLLVHVARLRGGIRRVLQITELHSCRDGEYRINELFAFKQTGIDAQGQAVGDFITAGRGADLRRRFDAAGIIVSDDRRDSDERASDESFDDSFGTQP